MQAILLLDDAEGGEGEGAGACATATATAIALLERAGQRLAGLRARLSLSLSLPSGAAHIRPPAVQAAIAALPSALEPDQLLRALEWLDANREGVAALPCLPPEPAAAAGAAGAGAGAAAAAAAQVVFHFSSAEDTPLPRQAGAVGGGGGAV